MVILVLLLHLDCGAFQPFAQIDTDSEHLPPNRAWDSPCVRTLRDAQELRISSEAQRAAAEAASQDATEEAPEQSAADGQGRAGEALCLASEIARSEAREAKLREQLAASQAEAAVPGEWAARRASAWEVGTAAPRADRRGRSATSRRCHRRNPRT